MTTFSSTPVVTTMQVIPVAGHDSMLMNLSGAHAPYFTRNIVIIKDNAGHTGVGEAPGGEVIYQTLLAAFAQRAGFTPEADCDLAVRLYAAAAELQALGIQSEWVLDQSFPQTARGVYLDYHAQMLSLIHI